MKRKVLTRLVVAALMAGTISFYNLETEAAVQVNPIQNIRPDFMKGVDVSMLPELEANGAKFYDVDGAQMDCLKVFKKHGVNWIRLRIWNDPHNSPGGGGMTDETRALSMAKRAKALGLKVLIDFHYSDWWADPGKQEKPKAWEHHDANQLAKDIYKYTAKVLKDFQKAGLEPDMIQIGNEIKNGMLWPEGQLPSKDGGKAFANMVGSGIKAVRDNDPDRSIKLMIHLSDGGDNAVYRSFFDSLINENKVNDFDIIGLSYYPFWNGPMKNLQQNMDDISARYNKDVVVVETAFGYTNENFDDMKNPYGPAEEKIGGFRSSVQGQATGLRSVMQHVADVPNGRGVGMFYWEPDWYPVPGVGWKDGAGSEWDNLAMFDQHGKALDSVEVFSRVSDKNGQIVKSVPVEVSPATSEVGYGMKAQLPERVMVTFSDDHTEDVMVNWDNPEPVYDMPGDYEVKGKIQGIKQAAVCKVHVVKKANLVQNPDFENVNLTGWTITGDTGAVNAISKSGDAQGKGAMHYWAQDAFHFTAQQSFTGLKDGKYTVAVSTQGGGGQSAYKLFVIGDDGVKKTTDIKDTKWNEWHIFTIKDIVIKNGKATIGVDLQGTPGNWGSIDNFEFYLQE